MFSRVFGLGSPPLNSPSAEWRIQTAKEGAEEGSAADHPWGLRCGSSGAGPGGSSWSFGSFLASLAMATTLAMAMRASQSFSGNFNDPFLSGVTGLFSHVRCTPQQNSQLQFWASVCVCASIYIYYIYIYSVCITMYVCKWWFIQFYVDIGWQIDNSVTALNPAWYFSETRTVAEILVACRMGYRHPWQHQLKNEPIWVSMQFPIMRTYSWTATYHWTEHPYKQESALKMNV